jgi:hypothetical protein
MWLSSFPAPFVKEAVFSPMHVFGTFVKNQLTEAAWVYFWVLYSDLHVFFLCQYYTVFLTMAL